MLSQVSKWGNSQGVIIPKKLLQHAGFRLDEKVDIKVDGSSLIITPVTKKTLEWYLEGYEGELDRYDWGTDDNPVGRELI